MPPGEIPFVLRPAAYNICVKYEAAVCLYVVFWRSARRALSFITSYHKNESFGRVTRPDETSEGKRRSYPEGMMCVEALFPGRELQRWHRSVCEDHVWCSRKYVMLAEALMWPNCRNEEEWRGEKWRSGVEWSQWAWPCPDHIGKTHTLRIGVLHRCYAGWQSLPR